MSYLLKLFNISIKYIDLAVHFFCIAFFWRYLIMSYIYEQYKKLKEKDRKSMYLFRSGKFYIFIGEDADTINRYVVLKKTKFCKEADKCGFPENRLENYLQVFRNQHLKIKVIDEQEDRTKEERVKKIIQSLDLNKITPIKALNLLKDIQDIYVNN